MLTVDNLEGERVGATRRARSRIVGDGDPLARHAATLTTVGTEWLRDSSLAPFHTDTAVERLLDNLDGRNVQNFAVIVHTDEIPNSDAGAQPIECPEPAQDFCPKDCPGRRRA